MHNMRTAPGFQIMHMSLIGKYAIRRCTGGEDYASVIGSVDKWWGGRRVSPMLPRLFFENFANTSFVVVIGDDEETGGTAGPPSPENSQGPTRPPLVEAPAPGMVASPLVASGQDIIVGFLCGFVSQCQEGEVGPQGLINVVIR